MAAPPPPFPAAEAPAAPEQPAQLPPREQPEPGLFDNVHAESRQIFCFPHLFFDGGKFTLSRPVGNSLQVSHSVALGSQSAPTTYHFSPTFLGPKRPGAGEAYPLVLGDIDSDGNLSARIIHEVMPGFRVQTNGQTQGKRWVAMQAEAEYHGSDWCSSLKLLNVNPIKESGIWVTNYMQKVSENLALGGEFTYQYGANGEMSGLSFGGKYRSKAKHWSVGLTFSPTGVLQASYVHAMANNRAQIAAELDVDARQGESLASLGVLYNFRQAVFRGQITSGGQVCALLEHSIAPTLALVLSGLIDHWHGQSRWGFGLTFQL